MITFLQVAGGLILLFLGGEVLVRGSVALAKNFGVSTFMIGLTVVAYGTSSPEMLISIQAVLDGYPDIATGNVIGSNISNILCVLGLTALIYPIAIDKKNNIKDTAIVTGVTILLYVACLLDIISLYTGLFFILLLIIYTYNLIRKSRKEKLLATDLGEDVPDVTYKTPIAILLCAVGFGLLILGANFMIEGAVKLATLAGV